MLLVLWAGLTFVRNDKKRYIVLMGFFAACASLEKWNGGAVCLYIAVLILLYDRKDIKKLFVDGVIALSSWLLSMIFIAPNILTDFDGLVEGITFTYVYDGSKQYPEILTYPKIFFAHLGLFSIVIAAIGLYSILQRVSENGGREWPVYLFPATCLLSQWLIMIRTSFERWGFSIYWGLLLCIVEGFFFWLNHGRILNLFSKIAVCLVALCFISESMLVDAIALRIAQDGRLVGETVLAEINATNENTLSDYYITLCPGGMRNEGTGIPIVFSEYGSEFAEVVDGVPTIYVPNLQYVVIGGYYGDDRYSKGYAVVREYGTLVAEVKSSANSLDLFYMASGYVDWKPMEIDNIRNNLRHLRIVLSGATIGPSFEVYDVSNFTYMKK